MKNLFRKKALSPSEKNRKRAGMSLVETMMAVAIFAAFMVGICQMMVVHRQMTDMARAHYTAVNIAKNRLELVRTFEFEQVGNFLEDKIRVDASGLADLNGEFRRSTTIANINGGLLELTVTVEIRDRKTLTFKGRKEFLSTYFAQYLTEESSVGAG